MHTRKAKPACKNEPRPGRPRRTRAQGPAAFTFAASLSLGTLSTAVAGPTGGVVVEGQGTISTPATGQTRIDQASNQLHLNWSTFDVAAHESVQFNQPSSSAVAFNRILDQNPSQIFGTIQANGQVVLVNPNGLLIGRTAQLNVGSLVASSLDAISFDAASGRYRFSTARDSTGAVINEGLISAGPGGSVTLLGGRVSNTGTIVADLGTVNLAAGRAATIDLAGDGLLRLEVGSSLGENADGSADAVHNSGTVQAAGGQVLLTAAAVQDVFTNLVNNTGVVRANRIDNSGGTIRLLGPEGTVRSSGTLDASAGDATSTGGSVEVLGDRVGLFGAAVVDVSGATGGGQALIGGDFQGKNPDVLNASRTYVGAGASIDADAGTTGDGGRVIVWADEVTRFDGSVTARGGTDSGNGGFAEVSGKQSLVFTGTANLGADQGAKGTLLLDPDDIIIDDSNEAPAAANDHTYAFTDDPGTTGTIGNATIEGLLETGDVILQAVDTITQSADADIDVSGVGAANGRGLTLEAGGDITLDGDIILNNGALTVTTTGGTASLNGVVSGSGVTVTSHDDLTAINVSAAGGSVSLESTDGGVAVGTIVGDNVTVTAGAGSITESGTSSITATDLELSASADIGGLGGEINTTAESLTAEATNGHIYIQETNDLTLVDVNAGGTPFSIRINAGGNLTVESVEGTGEVQLGAGGSILDDNNNSTRIIADHLQLTAANSIGAEAGNGQIDTEVASLTATASAGSVTIGELDGLTLVNVSAAGAGNDVRVTTTSGDITVFTVSAPDEVQLTASAGSILDDGINTNRISATSLTLTAGAIGASGTLDGIDTDVESLTANATSGSVFIDEADDIALTSVTASDSINITSGDDMTVFAVNATNAVALTSTSGSILDDNANGTRIQANSLTLTAGEEIGASGTDAQIDTAVTSLTATAGGSVYVGENNGVALNGVTAGGASGVIEVTSAAGDITVGALDAQNATTLTASLGSILDDNDNATRIETGTLALNAGAGIGSGVGDGQIDTAATSLSATTGNGSVFIGETDGVTLTNVTAGGAHAVTVTAGGNITVGTVQAAASVALTTTSGSIQDDNDNLTVIATDALTLSAAGNIGSTGTIEQIDTAVASLNATATSGSVYLREQNGLELGTVTAGGVSGDVEITSTTGSITVGAVSAVDSVTLTATNGSILDDGLATRIVADRLALNAGASVGASPTASWIDTDVDSLSVFSGAGSSGVFIDELDGLTVTSVTTTGVLSDISISAGGDLSVGTVTTNSGNVELASTAGSILNDGDNTTRISANQLTLSATGSIGVGANGPIDTNVDSLIASAGAGSVFIRELNGLMLTNVSAAGAGNDIDITSDGGDITVDTLSAPDAVSLTATTGSVLDDDDDTTRIVASSLSLNAGNAVGTAAANGQIDATVTSLAANASNGSIFVHEADGVTLTNVTAAGVGSGITVNADGPLTVQTVTAPGTVSLATTNAGGIQDDGNNTTRIAAGNLVLDSVGSIGAASANAQIDTNVTSVTATSTAGNVYLAELNGLTLTNVSAAGGAVEVSSDTGDITVNTVSAPGSVALTATTGSILNDGLNITRINTNTLTMNAGTAIGTADANGKLDTNVTSLSAAAGNGGVFIGELTGVTLTSVSAAGGTNGVVISSGDTMVVGSVVAPGTVALTSSPGSIINDSDSSTRIVADQLSLTASLLVGVPGQPLDIDVASVTAASTQGVYLNELNGVTLSSVSGGNGDVDVTSTTGDITVGAVSSANAVRLTAAAGGIDDDNNDATVISAPGITLEAATNIGEITDFGLLQGRSVDVQVSGFLTASVTSDTGRINLNLSGAPTLGADISLGSGSGAAGAIIVQSSGNLDAAGFAPDAISIGTNNTTAVALSSGGTLTLPAGGGFTDQPADTLLVRGAVDVVENDGTPREFSFAANNLDFQSGSAGGETVLVTSVGSLNATVGNGQNLTIDENDNLTVGTVASAGGDVTILAGGAIADDNDDTTRVSGNTVALSGTSLGASGNALDTEAISLIATATSGSAHVVESNALNLTATATNGVVDVQTIAGALTVSSASGTGVALSAGGAGSDLILNGAVNGGTGNVSLTAGTAGNRGNIVAGVGSHVSGNALTAVGATVGASAAPLNTSVASLNATSTNGGIFVTESDALALTANAAVGPVNVQTNNGALTAGAVSGNGVTLATGGDGSTLTLNGSLDAGSGAVSLTTSGAGSAISANGNITSTTGDISLVTNGADSDISANGEVTSTGDISLVTNGADSDISANGEVTSTGDISLVTNDASSDISANGDITSTTGDISLVANGAGSNLSLAGAVTTGGNVTLTAGAAANRGAIVAGIGNQVSANALTADGASIGTASSALNTNVASINATSTNGGIHIAENDALALTANATGGALEVTAGGSMTVAAVSGQGVSLTASGAASDLTLNGAVNGGAGPVALAASDELVLNGTVATTGGVDLTSGGTTTLNASVSGTNVNITAGPGGSRAIIAGAGNFVSGTNLTLRGSSVGSDVERLNTAVGSVDALTTNGGIFVTEADALSLSAVSGAGPVDVRTLNGALTVGVATGDSVTLVAAGDGNGITVNSGGVLGRAGAVTMTTTGADSDIVLNGAVSANDQLALTTGAGGDIALNAEVVAAAGATLTAGTAGNGGNVVAGALNNLAGDSITISAASIGSSSARLNTATNTLNTTSTAGGTYVTDEGSLSLTASATGGALDVRTTTGTLTVVSAAGDSVSLGAGDNLALTSSVSTTGDVTLTANGAITAAAGTQISANALTATGAAIGASGERLTTTVGSLNATSMAGGIYVTESDSLALTASATGGAVDVETSNGSLTVGGASGSGVTLVAGGAGSGITVNGAVSASAGDVTLTAEGAGGAITVNGAVNAGAGDVTLTAGTAANRGAIAAGAGNLVSGNVLTATGSAIGSNATSLNTNVTMLTASASNGGVYINEQNGLTLADVTASGAAGNVRVTSGSGDIVVHTVTASGDATLGASGGAIRDDGDDTTRITANTLTLQAQSIGAPSTLTGTTLDSSMRLDTTATALNATATNGGVFIDELDGLQSVSLQAGGGAAGDIELLTATGDLNLQSVQASDTLLLAAGHNIFARPGASPISARVAELRAGGADPAAGRIGTQNQLIELNLSPGNSLRLFVPQTVDPDDPTRAPSTLPSPGVTTTLSIFSAPDVRATLAGFSQFQSVSDTPFTSAAEALVRTVQNQTTTVQSVLGLDWASFDTNVSLFGTLEPAVCLPADQRDEEEGSAGC